MLTTRQSHAYPKLGLQSRGNGEEDGAGHAILGSLGDQNVTVLDVEITRRRSSEAKSDLDLGELLTLWRRVVKQRGQGETASFIFTPESTAIGRRNPR